MLHFLIPVGSQGNSLCVLGPITRYERVLDSQEEGATLLLGGENIADDGNTHRHSEQHDSRDAPRSVGNCLSG